MQTWQWLGYLGLIPFVACLWLFNTPIDSLSNDILFNPQQAFIFYSSILLSFLAGTLWRKDNLTQQTKMQIFSNFLFLYAFICLFIPTFYALIFLPIGYLGLFLVEHRLCNNKEHGYTHSYFTMRLILTVLVISLHVIALMSWF